MIKRRQHYRSHSVVTRSQCFCTYKVLRTVPGAQETRRKCGGSLTDGIYLSIYLLLIVVCTLFPVRNGEEEPVPSIPLHLPPHLTHPPLPHPSSYSFPGEGADSKYPVG